MIAAKQSSPSERRRHLLTSPTTAKSILIISLSLSFSAWMTRSAPSSPLLHAHAFSPSPPSPPSGIIRSRSVIVPWQSAVAVTSTRYPPPVVLLSRLYADTSSTTQDESTSDDNDTTTTAATNIDLPIPNDMRLREIQSELKEKNISYTDCFDRESLVKRLLEARDGLVQPSIPPPSPTPKEVKMEEKSPVTTTAEQPTSQETSPPVIDVDTTTSSESNQTPPQQNKDDNNTPTEFDRESTLASLRTLRVKELKIQLSSYKVRWGTMIEKEEMVVALCNAMQERFEQSLNFSRSGALIPGRVGDVEEGVLLEELGWGDDDLGRVVAGTNGGGGGNADAPHSPILLDVYATWCGPCKFMEPLLSEAAEELGPTVRVVKLDSDKYPRISSVLKVGGLPTLIRFDGGDVSKEVERMEGVLTKDQIIDFVNGNFKR